MSGHSKWSKIKRKKAAADVKRGKVITKLLREIQVAARLGGINIDGNPRLKAAVQSAKSLSVPGDNIERAINRGSGEGAAADYEDILYEAYGPAGVALLIKVLTDNRNRSVAEVRHALSRSNGSLGGSNSVAYLFKEKGIINVPKSAVKEDELIELALEAGAQDVVDQGEYWDVLTEPSDFTAVSKTVEKLGKTFEGQVQPVPVTTVPVTGKDAETVLKLMDMLDDLDDVQSVVANFEIDEKELELLSRQ